MGVGWSQPAVAGRSSAPSVPTEGAKGNAQSQTHVESTTCLSLRPAPAAESKSASLKVKSAQGYRSRLGDAVGKGNRPVTSCHGRRLARSRAAVGCANKPPMKLACCLQEGSTMLRCFIDSVNLLCCCEEDTEQAGQDLVSQPWTPVCDVPPSVQVSSTNSAACSCRDLSTSASASFFDPACHRS